MTPRWLNSTDGYGWASILLHWVSFVLVLVLLASGVYMVTLSYYDPLYHRLPHWHKIAGVCITALTLFRLAWNLLNPHPLLLPAPRWQQISARSVHGLFYVLLFALGITGYVMTTAADKPLEWLFGWQIPALRTWPADIADTMGLLHEWIAYGVAVLILFHSTAALYHHFSRHDATLRRILKPPR